ncbi:MAG: OsmC family protein [Chloroflexota bacterium]
MKISARITNSLNQNDILVETNGNQKELAIAPKILGRGSSINGGELLFAAIATCACNDIYREAGKKNMQIDSIDVSVSGEFGEEGEAASNIIYNVKVDAPTLSRDEIVELVNKVDSLVEIHNTVRLGTNIKLVID